MAALEEEDFAEELLLELGEDGIATSSPSDESSADTLKGSVDGTDPYYGAADVCHGNTQSSLPLVSSDASAPKRQKLGLHEGRPRPVQEPSRAQGQSKVGAQASPLTQLTPEVLLRVMCFLSPEDLSTLGRVSRLFTNATTEASLWRRLYYMRWPQGPKNEEEEAEVVYMERDHQELSESVQAAPALLKPMFAQMATAKRSEALGVGHTEHLFRLRPPKTPLGSGASARGGAAGGSSRAGGGGAASHHERMEQVGQSIEVFRRQRGLLDGSLHGAHCCGDGECRGFTHLGGDVWICANTGYVHRCGENCREREVDSATNNLVCPISGRCFDRMMSEDEEEQQAQERGVEEGRGEEEWQEGISGRLGRAFLAGYNASDERDLMMLGLL
ncbi:hypothetical protein N2152v2_002118 [Parachlorella kessleri]